MSWTIAPQKRTRKNVERCGPRCLRPIDGCLDLLASGDAINGKLDVMCTRRVLQCVQLRRRVVDISKGRDPASMATAISSPLATR